MTITAKVRFDRESDFPGKRMKIPIIVQDSQGFKTKKSVYVIIGDQNDSPMSDGRMNILVYSYLGQLKRTNLGYPFVSPTLPTLGHVIFIIIHYSVNSR